MARILVAEDDASANKLISAVLRRDNHEVLSAVDVRMRSTCSIMSMWTSS